MNVPKIRYYARFNDVTKGKTAKYTCVADAGFYEPMRQLVGKDGKVSMYLLPKLETQTKSSTPPMKLQAKGSYNFTGLKEYYADGKLSGFAWGYPLDEETYSNKKKANPFYEYREDCFLFVMHQRNDAQTEAERTRPESIELIVVEGGKLLGASYCKMLMIGGFDEALDALREQAQVE